MTKIRLGARQGALLRYVAGHPGVTSVEIFFDEASHGGPLTIGRRMSELYAYGLVNCASAPGRDASWTVSDAGWEWLSTRATPMARPTAPKRLVVGRRMREVVAYVAKHEGCTKYAAGKAVTRLGNARDGWVIVQRAINAGLISQRLRRDGTMALSVTDKGWVS